MKERDEVKQTALELIALKKDDPDNYHFIKGYIRCAFDKKKKANQPDPETKKAI